MKVNIDSVISTLNKIIERYRLYTNYLEFPGEWGERAFRGWLVFEVFHKLLGWPIENIIFGERYDVLFVNSDIQPVIYLETKKPKRGLADLSEFKSRSKYYRTLIYAVLTDGYKWLRIDLIRSKKTQVNLKDKAKITENAFSPGFTYKHIKDASDEKCAWGSSLNDALQILKTKGTVRYSTLSINCPQSIADNLIITANSFKISDYAKLFGLTDGTAFKIQAVKKSLSQKNPVVIGMLTPNSFYQAKDLWEPTESHLGNYGGHAMCVIGYDDNKYGGAFLFQNSWGVQWGNQGYTWVKYSDFANFTKYAYEIIGNMASGYPIKTDEAVALKGSIRYELGNGQSMTATRSANIFKMKNSYKSGEIILISEDKEIETYCAK